MFHLSVSQARQKLSELLDFVGHHGQQVVLMRNGKPLVAVIPVGDLDLYHALEDRRDRAATRRAQGERGSIPLERLARELGLERAEAARGGATERRRGGATAPAPRRGTRPRKTRPARH